MFILISGDVFGKASLKGGPEVIERYLNYALNNNFRFADDAEVLDEMLQNGEVTYIVGNKNYRVEPGVAQQFLHPLSKRVLEILSEQYKRSCSQTMRVTGAFRTRDYNDSLDNSTKESLHMTGLAFDIGAKKMTRRCRAWIESRLLHLEENGYLDATRENFRPHYHVVVYVTKFDEVAISEIQEQIHVVKSGESFYQIARTYGISTNSLMSRNGLKEGDIIHPGDELILPLN